MRERILITGGSGYLGSHVRNYFGADNFSRSIGRDVTNPDHASCIADYDAVVHLAASVDKTDDGEPAAFDVNVRGTVNLLRFLRKDQIFLMTSTKEVYGRHANALESVNEECPIDRRWGAYAWSKFIAEECVAYYAVRARARAAVFRLSTTYAPVNARGKGTFVNLFADSIRNGDVISLAGGGCQVRDFLHVNDFARAIERFLASDVRFGTFNIGGGASNATTLNGLAETLGALIGRAPRVESVNSPQSVQTRYVTDNGKAGAELGWSPEISLRAGLRTIL
jgi:nucleoside-diphosphate-sugar epimerase